MLSEDLDIIYFIKRKKTWLLKVVVIGKNKYCQNSTRHTTLRWVCSTINGEVKSAQFIAKYLSPSQRRKIGRMPNKTLGVTGS